MKKVIAVFLFAAIFSGCSGGHDGDVTPSARVPEVRVGSTAPDFILRDMAERNTTLSEYKGKVVVLTFWNMKCKDCLESMQSLDGLSKRFREQDLSVIAINDDNLEYVKPERIVNFIKSKNYSFKILFDETFSASEAYKIVAIPMTFIIDRSGTVSYMKFGKEDWESRENLDLIQNLISK